MFQREGVEFIFFFLERYIQDFVQENLHYIFNIYLLPPQRYWQEIHRFLSHVFTFSFQESHVRVKPVQHQ